MSSEIQQIITGKPCEQYSCRLLRAIHKMSPALRLNFLAMIVGLLAGVGAWILKVTIDWFFYVMFLLPKEYLGRIGLEKYDWLPFLISPVIGGIMVGYITTNVSQETRGHGVPEVMEAVWLHNGRMKLRVPFMKIVASAITLGSGGSAGREGPIAQIGAGLGSVVGQKLHLNPKELRIMVIAGVGAGISAIFNAPIGGALFAVEILARSEMGLMFVPVIIASVVGTVVGQFFFGPQPTFTSVPEFHYHNPALIPLFIILGILLGFVSTYWIKFFYFFEDFFENTMSKKWGVSPMLTPAIGGFLVGIIHVGIYILKQDNWLKFSMVGLTYEPMEAVFRGEYVDELVTTGAMIILSLFILKALTTALTIGSGGSGGVFAPTLFLGIMFGFLFGFLSQHLLGFDKNEVVVFAILGMAGMFAGTGKAPLTAIIMSLEITNDYFLIIPLMFTVTFSWVISTRLDEKDIYIVKLDRRGVKIGDADKKDILNTIPVTEAMTPMEKLVIVDAKSRLEEVLELAKKTRHSGFPVFENDRFVGVITLSDVQRALAENPKEWSVKDILLKKKRPVIAISSDASLAEAVSLMARRDVSRLPVVEGGNNENRLVGWITHHDITSTYMKQQMYKAYEEFEKQFWLINDDEEKEEDKKS